MGKADVYLFLGVHFHSGSGNFVKQSLLIVVQLVVSWWLRGH